jgi:Spy/CpxP family protein refolding chaperone
MRTNPELMKQLNLTAAQQAKLKAIGEKYRAQFPKPQPGQQPDRAAWEKMKPVMDAMRKEMEAVYTPKQREIMKKWRESHRGRAGSLPGSARPGGPGASGAKIGPAKGGHTGGGHGG